MENIAGQMNLDLARFYEMTPRQFQNIFEGWNSIHKQEWEKVRIISFYSALQGLKKGVKPKKLMAFPWDDEVNEVEPEPANMPSDEEIQESRLFWENLDKKKKT